jgi:transposase-like protein
MTTRRWTKRDAGEALTAWQRSGETMTAFCRRTGVSAQRLAWWRKRLAEPAAMGESAGAFVPVVVRSASGAGTTRVVLGTCEVELAELTEQTAAWVAALARALGEGR